MLLIISFIIRQYYPVNIGPAFGQNTLTLPQKGSSGSHKAIVKIAYFDAHSSHDQNTPEILLIHGNPVAARTTFQRLIPDLSRFGCVIAPDLPGFGAATRNISDYSSYAQARYMLRLLDHLKIDQVHIVAYSMGDGVALNMAHMAPDQIRSITMLSAVGVQQLELLGNYYINHALYGFQRALICFFRQWFATYGVDRRISF